MNILDILITVIIVGIILYCIDAYIPMQSTVKKILNTTVIILLVIWLLKIFGVLQRMGHWKI